MKCKVIVLPIPTRNLMGVARYLWHLYGERIQHEMTCLLICPRVEQKLN